MTHELRLSLPAGRGDAVESIDTPALVVDLDAMERNLEAMAAFARSHGVRLRPHAKMHKSATIARLQIDAGAVGVCVQKTSEAEALAAAGIDDIYISNEVSTPPSWRVSPRSPGASGSRSRSIRSRASIASPRRRRRRRHDRCLRRGRRRPGPLRRRRRRRPASSRARVARRRRRRPALRRRAGVPRRGAAPARRRGARRGDRSTPRRWRARRRRASAPPASPARSSPAPAPARSRSTSRAASGASCRRAAISSWTATTPTTRRAGAPRFEHALFVKSRVMSRGAAHAVVDAGHKSHAIDSGLPRVWQRELAYANGGDEHGILRPHADAARQPAGARRDGLARPRPLRSDRQPARPLRRRARRPRATASSRPSGRSRRAAASADARWSRRA